MLSNNESISFLATLAPEASREFYETKLGLKLISEDHFALVFKLREHTLRIARVEQLTPAKHTVHGWRVSDIAATVAKLSADGVDFERYPGMDQNELGIWTSPSGAKIAWFKDPDGNNLSLTEFPTHNKI